MRIAATKLPKADLDRIVKTLQEDKVVGFIAIDRVIQPESLPCAATQ